MEKEHKKTIKNDKSAKEQKPFFHYELSEEDISANEEEEVMEFLAEITKVDEY